MTPRAAALALLLVSAAATASAAAPRDTLALATRERIVRETHDLIRDHFAHWSALPGYRFEERFDAYRRRALAIADRRAFSLATRELVASLANGHTTYADTWTRAQDPAQVPFALGWIGGEWVVLTSRLSGLAPGDVVTKVDSRPIEELYASIARYLCASNERARRREFTWRGFLWPASFTLATADGRELRVSRSVAPATPEPPALSDRWLVPDSIAYLAITSFGERALETRAVELVRTRYRSAPALIVDVRGNGGGDTPRTLAKTLLDGRPYVWWKEDPVRLPMAAFDQMGAAFKRLGGVGPTYAGRLFLLTDGGCASACEDFVMPLAWQHRATVVGDTTMGTTGQPVFREYDCGITIGVSAKRAHFPDGSPFEGVGIAPDVLVPPTRADLASGADRALATALALARRALAEGAPKR